MRIFVCNEIHCHKKEKRSEWQSIECYGRGREEGVLHSKSCRVSEKMIKIE
jgi:hypothetical protein